MEHSEVSPFIPNEALTNILECLSRNELDMLELVNPRMKELSHRFCAHITGRIIYRLEISYYGYRLELSEDGRRFLHFWDWETLLTFIGDCPELRIHAIRYINALSIPKRFPPLIMSSNTRLELCCGKKDYPWLVHRISTRNYTVLSDGSITCSEEPTMQLQSVKSFHSAGLVQDLNVRFSHITIRSEGIGIVISFGALVSWLNYGYGRPNYNQRLRKKHLTLPKYVLDMEPAKAVNHLWKVISAQSAPNPFEITFEKVRRKEEVEKFAYVREINQRTQEMFEFFPLQPSWDDGSGGTCSHRTWILRRGPITEEEEEKKQ